MRVVLKLEHVRKHARPPLRAPLSHVQDSSPTLRVVGAQVCTLRHWQQKNTIRMGSWLSTVPQPIHHTLCCCQGRSGATSSKFTENPSRRLAVHTHLRPLKNVRVRASTRVRTGVMSRACSLIKWSARDSEGRWRGLVFFRDRLRDVRIHVHLRTSSSQLAARRAKWRGQVASALGARAIGSVQECGCAAGTGYPHPARSATRAARASHAARSECAPRRSS
jgi:hypothetical protein